MLISAATILLKPVNVVTAPVLVEELPTVVKEESAKAKLIVCAAPLTLLTEIFSMPVKVTAEVEPAVPPVTERLNVSVPVPPFKTSPACIVVPVVFAAATLAITALNESSPVPPVKTSTPVVSDLSKHFEKSFQNNHLR